VRRTTDPFGARAISRRFLLVPNVSYAAGTALGAIAPVPRHRPAVYAFLILFHWLPVDGSTTVCATSDDD
jgi:hypothetical protein